MCPDFKPFVPAAKSPVLPLSQISSIQEKSEPVKNAKCKKLDPSTQSSITLGAAPLKPHVSENLDERKYRIDEHADHLYFKIHKIKLLDSNVISYSESIKEGRLLSLVHSAFKIASIIPLARGSFSEPNMWETAALTSRFV